MAIGINGLGRVGRLVLKDFFGGFNRKSNNEDINILHLNEPNCDAKTLCHLLKFDSAFSHSVDCFPHKFHINLVSVLLEFMQNHQNVFIISNFSQYI